MSSLHRPIARAAITAAATLLLTTSLTACSDSSTQDSGEVANASSAAAVEFNRTVDAYIDSMKSKQTATPPTEGPKAVPGKRIVIVTITEAETAAQRALAGMEEAASVIGWDHSSLNANGNLNVANQQLQQAVATKPDAIILLGLDKTQVGSGMQAALSANIPVACFACWDLSAPDTKGDYASVQPQFSGFHEMGYANAAYAYQQTDGAPKFLTFNDASLSNLLARQQGFDRFMDECRTAGASCEVVADQPFQVANTTTTLAAQAASVAQANPSFNAVWASFDFAAQYVINGFRQAGKVNDSSFLVSANGDPANVKAIKDGGYQKATVAYGIDWGGWAIIDDLNRVFAGESLVDENAPFRLFDSSNIDEAEGGAWRGDVDFVEIYRQVWGR